MAKVLCTLPNASELINGVKFAVHAKGMLSEDISDDQAADFASISGYELVGSEPTKTATDADAERLAIVAQLEQLGVSVKGNWGPARLKSELESALAAKKAADDAAAAKATSDETTKPDAAGAGEGA